MPSPEQSDVRNTNIGEAVRSPVVVPASHATDPWTGLRRFTAARIALGRSGGSQRTDTVLDFRLSHARARDAVHAVFDSEALVAALSSAGLPSLVLASAVADRRAYLLRPDLGRRLCSEAQARLAAFARTQATRPDLVVVVSDGLAAAAAQSHALATVVPLTDRLTKAGWRLAPVVVVPLARVKIQDEIGAALGARYTLMLLGERPGLGTPDSLGAYFTKDPAPERTDADRNCVSNIRPEGLPPAQAAEKLAALLLESARSGLSGVQLKDMTPSSALTAS